MVANVSPAAACLKETHSTLGFAHRAKMIKNKVCLSATELTAPQLSVCLHERCFCVGQSVCLSVCLIFSSLVLAVYAEVLSVVVDQHVFVWGA